MRFSRSVRSSRHSVPSPNGLFIATLFPSVINIREVKTLDVVKIIRLPADLSGPVYSFQWSPSSRLVLVAVGDQIQVVSADDTPFEASIRNAVPPAAKPSSIGFAASDTEVWVCSSFGLKLTLFDLTTLKGVEISNPKFFTPATTSNGFSLRPITNHSTIMTRTAGKDTISIHDPATKEVQRSWYPDTVDAQGLKWSPDGRWLIVWESDGQGHKVIFYTADGNTFKTWTGPAHPQPEDKHYPLGPGVKLVQFSADSRHLAIGDHSRGVCILDMTSVNETMRLFHPNTIVPCETIQIWQEQVSVVQTGPSLHTFIKATQAISPPGRTTKDNSDPKTGVSSVFFDASSGLIATRLDDAPSTVWIWDIQASELRAVLLFHSEVQSVKWHPTSRETLLIRCDGDLYNGIVFVWDPLSEGPRTIDFTSHLPDRKVVGRSQASWLCLDDSETPSLFFSDGQNYVLASVAESDQDVPYWQGGGGGEAQRQESPLELVPAAGSADPYLEEEDEDVSELEDTFIHKH
ncbi:WD40 repeat-like protein [Coniochaeta ligniaria NRRL 30616]|uniref:WD40 repeat-like protein n=1 Tax=Coniochaeta ligniaria NRRL 30616 TaxID=1408157 RepID=A0A1J7JU74_9PEZI|nr:WD40 repeat-like protein [Coniochaeta ligniaria NRRL 30616]